MKKKKQERVSWRDIWSFFAGLITIYAITLFLLFIRLFAQGYLDIKNGNAFSTMIHLTNTKDLHMTLLKNAINFYGEYGMITGVFLFILIGAFGFMGWLILKIADHKVWYLPALPVIFMALFSFNLTSDGNYSTFSMPFTQMLEDSWKPYFIVVCLLVALSGGWIQRHISVQK